MPAQNESLWIIFGGGGFIGRHLARHLLDSQRAKRLILADITFLPPNLQPEWYRSTLRSGRLLETPVDVRSRTGFEALPTERAVIVNLAAVHREPGHQPEEYFETNVTGAENIVGWATRTDCKRLVFTSSISVYGDTRGGVDETSLTAPLTPYGASKLAAEKIFAGWQAANPDRTLVIIRPAVVFGEGESGNVSRLVRAVVTGRFVLFGNETTLKAGGYVKDLCACLTWLLELPECSGHTNVANFSLPDIPTLADYIHAIQHTCGRQRFMPRLPYHVVLGLTLMVALVCKLFGFKTDLHPRRVEKLRWHTHVLPRYLVEHGYDFRYTLLDALADWQRDSPAEWRF